mmetsp:Transcript_21090/g.38129  ORF Transcript_21090/g.38129 Transcript_21090/m.38129 type:complete len:200 (-) Transcript_21090:2337-2936(-)
MLLARRTIIIIGHVRSGNNEVTVRPREAMRAHVILVLFEDDGSAWDEEAWIIGADRHIVVVSAITDTALGGIPRLLEQGPFTPPNIHIPNIKFRLHMPPQKIINTRAKDAWSTRKQGIDRVGHGEDGVGTEHIVVIDGGEAVANVVNDNFDGAGEEGVAGGGGDEAVPEAASVSDFDAGLIDRSHETNIIRNGIVQVGL